MAYASNKFVQAKSLSVLERKLERLENRGWVVLEKDVKNICAYLEWRRWR